MDYRFRGWRAPGLGSLAAAGIFLVLMVAPARSTARQQAQSPRLPTLTTAKQVRELTTDEANRGYPVRLRAVVTYVDFDSPDFFAQDATAGIFTVL
jgi:hypothetical protein